MEFLKHIAEALREDKERWILWLPVGLGTGAASYFGLHFEPHPIFSIVFLVVALASVWFSLRYFHKALIVSIALAAIASGFVLAQLRVAMVEAPVLEAPLEPTWVRGTIEALEPQTSGYRVYLSDVSIWRFPKAKTPLQVRLNIRTPINGARPGDRISVRAVLSPPPWPVYPGAYDFARWAYFKQIGATGFSLSPVEIRQKADHPGIIVDRLRHAITERIYSHLPMEKEGSKAKASDAGTMAAALLTGERGAIPKKVLEQMRSSGLGHLLAISGLHLVLVTATVFYFLRAGIALIPTIALRHNTKKWAAIAAISVGFFYLLITGMPVSAQRAFMMTSLFFLAILLDRTGTPMRPIAFAAFIILLFTPESVMHPSFQMSFAAATALIAAYERTTWFRQGSFKERSPWRTGMLYVLGMMFSSFIAGMATAPFAIYHFSHFAPYGILANLMAIPLTSFLIMPLGILGLALMPLGLEWLALIPMGWGIEGVIGVAEWVGNIPYASMGFALIDTVGLAFIALGGVWICIWRTKVRWLGAAPVVLAFILGLFHITPDIIIDGGGKLFALRAGDGQMVVSSKQTGRYAREIWLEKTSVNSEVVSLMDIEKKKAYKYLADHEGVQISCLKSLCRYQTPFGKVVIVRPGKRAGRARDVRQCEELVLLITLGARVRACEGKTIMLNTSNMEEKGTHLVWLEADGIRMQSVKETLGVRPWVREYDTEDSP